MFFSRFKIPATSSPIWGYIIGSPPQIETIGAPHSSTAARHSSSGTRSVIVDSYSRMRPQPVQVRLQACSGSSISTSGKRRSRRSRFVTMYPAISVVRLSGKRMGGLALGLDVDPVPLRGREGVAAVGPVVGVGGGRV